MKNVKKNNKVDIKNKLKHKDKLIPYSNIELAFNIISLVIAIGVGIYFGGRSFYYYGKLAKMGEADNYTLNGSIKKNNQVVMDGDGLHQDTLGYYFKGNVFNNYVKFGNRLFRVIRVNNDGSVKLVTQDIVSEFMWGENSDYINSNLDNWLDKKDNVNGSGVYYDTIPYPKDFLVKTNYSISKLNGKNVVDSKDSLESYVTTLTIKDYNSANGKNSYLNINKYFWLIGNDENNNNLYVSEDGTLLEGNLYESYGIRPVITLKSDTPISSGSGTSNDPYIINQGEKTNLINTTVNLGNYSFVVFYDKDDIVKLVHNNYSADGMSYSRIGSTFNPLEVGSVPNFLNTEFYNILPNKEKLLDTIVYTGEVSSDTSLDFTNIYNSYVTSKIGMLNLFDYHILGGDDYFLSNTTSTVGSMVYVYHNYGLLEEVEVSEKKRTIPVITLSKNDIDTSKNPYVVR